MRVRRWRRRCSWPPSGGADADARRRSRRPRCGRASSRGSIAPARPISTTPARRCIPRRSCGATRAGCRRPCAATRTPTAGRRSRAPTPSSARAPSRSSSSAPIPRVYDVVFTANASGAIRILAEAFPFERNSRLVLTADNHNSVNGLAWPARRARARVRAGAAARRPARRRSGARARARGGAVALRVSGAVELLRRAASARVGARGAGARLPRAARRRVVRAVGARSTCRRRRPTSWRCRSTRSSAIRPASARWSRAATRWRELRRRYFGGGTVDYVSMPHRLAQRKRGRGGVRGRHGELSRDGRRVRRAAVDGARRHGCGGPSHGAR